MGQELPKRRDVISGPHAPWAGEKYAPYSPIKPVPSGRLKGLLAYDVFLLTDTGGSLPRAIANPDLIQSHEDRQKHVELEMSEIEKIQAHLNELAATPAGGNKSPSEMNDVPLLSLDAFAKVREHILKEQKG
jgi:hypothetical protein